MILYPPKTGAVQSQVTNTGQACKHRQQACLPDMLTSGVLLLLHCLVEHTSLGIQVKKLLQRAGSPLQPAGLALPHHTA